MNLNTRNFAGWAVRLAALLILFGVALSLLPAPALAVPANQKVWTFTQPDGTKFQAILKGDEFYAWHQTPDGSIILQDPKSGTWYYAIPQTDGSLKSTTMAVGTTAVKTTTLNKELTPWLQSVEKAADARAQEMSANFLKAGRVPPTGTVKGVMLLANFSDTTPTFDQATFSSLMNTPGYSANGALGSVRDYYLEASYGQLTLQTDVFGWFTLPQTKAYYGGNTGGPGTDANPKQMIIDAINASDATVNYANYDADGDGKVDFFGVIHQGQGEEQGGASSDCIWSHRWSLDSPMTVDGKTIQAYHTEPELLYSSLTTIGVICHETGHFFGLPDLYDTTYASEGIGQWSIMASGSWCGPGGNGAKPCHFDPWCKMKLDWMTPTLVTAPLTAAALPAWDKNPSALMIPIDPYLDGEYFLVCNRYQRSGAAGAGFDQYLPGSGALVLHIDDDVAGNDNVGRKQVDVEEADGLAELDKGLNRGNAGDLYPNGGTVFNDTSNPNSKDNSGASTGVALSNFTGGGTANMTVNVTPIPALSGTSIIYDANGNSMGLGYDGDDYGCVRFTSATGGTLKRVKAYFTYSGTTNYTVSVYSGWGTNQPTGQLTTQSGSHSGVGYQEIVLASPQTIAPGSDFYVKVRFNTGGAYRYVLPLGEDLHPDGRSFVGSYSTSFTNLTDMGYGSYDLDIRADLTPPAPAISSITRVDPSPNAGNSVSFLVTFSQTVGGVSASNFALTTTGAVTGASVSGVSGSGATRTVTVNTGSGDGTIRLDLANATGITDSYGQGVTGTPYTSGEVYDINHELPHVTGITRAGSSPTNSATVAFNVAFNVAVTGVDVTDFVLMTSGVSGATVSGVSGSGSAWTVTVNTGSGSGTIRLDVVDDDSIMDAGSVPLGGAGTGNGNYTSGDVDTIDKTAPTAAISSTAPSLVHISPIPVTVTFSEPVTGFAAGDLAVGNGTVSNFAGSGSSYTFNLFPAGQGAVTVNIAGGAAEDLAGNASSAASQFSRTYDSVAPALTALTPDRGAVVSGVTSVQVTFSEAVSGVAAGGLTVNGSAATSLSGSGAGPYTFSGFAAPADGTVSVALAAGAIKDLAGNAFAGDAWSVTKDATLPTVVLASADVAKGGAINHAPAFTATFSSNVTGFTAGDITVANGSVSGFAGSGKEYSFTVHPTANGSTTVAVNAGVANDASAPFNPNAAASPYAFTYDTVAPQSQVTTPANNASLTSSTFTVTWTSSDTGGSGVKNVIIVWAKDSLSTATVAGSPFAPATTSVTFTGPGSGTYSFYSIATDQAGNVELPPSALNDVRFRVLPKSTALPGWRYYW